MDAEMDVKRCKECGAPMPVRSKACPKCKGVGRVAEKPSHEEKHNPIQDADFAETVQASTTKHTKGLVKCKGCEEWISKKAAACPHCGEPGKKKTSGCTWLVAVFVVFPVFGLFIMATHDESTTPVVQKVADVPVSKADCLKSADCIFEKYVIDAEVYCPKYIQRYAQYDYKWTDGLLGYKFTKVSVVSGGVVRFYGDSLQFQNQYGAWSNVVYSCDFDTVNESVIAANAEDGRLQ